MTFDYWIKNRCRDSLDWVTESEVLLKNGLIPFEGSDKHYTNQRTTGAVHMVYENLVCDGFGTGEPVKAYHRVGRKPKAKGCRNP